MSKAKPVERLYYRPSEVAAMVGVSRGKVFLAIKEGKLKALKHDGAVLISVAAFQEWMSAAVPIEAHAASR